MSAPRLLARALVTSFITVAIVLAAVLAVLSLQVRDQVRRTVTDNLASAQQVFTKVEERRQQDLRALVATLAENPTLKAALDTWLTERSTANPQASRELLATVQREADKIAVSVSADVLAVADRNRHVVASGGRMAASWPRGVVIGAVTDASSPSSRAVAVGHGMYHVVSVPLQFGEAAIGSLELGTALDAGYARALADLSRGHAAILSKSQGLASTLGSPAARDLAASLVSDASGPTTITLAGESWAIQPLSQLDDVTFLALASIDLAAAAQTQAALTAAEFESIKTHPSAGARILRSFPFLAPHIPIVELHHERPDGRGCPYGLRGREIPLAARIVHVAGAFDAMTSARASRAGRLPIEAIAELRRCIGSDFDGPSVEALVAALPRLVGAAEPSDSMVLQWAQQRARSA